MISPSAISPLNRQRSGGETLSGFISTWNTANTSTGSSNSDQVTLPLIFTGTYDFTVDWGDGTTNAINAWDASEKTHTYASAGIYTISIEGIITGWQFNNSGDRLKLIDVSQWDEKFTISNTNAFYGCANMNFTATDAPILTGNIGNMFRNASSFNGYIGSWNVSNVTDMTNMFFNAISFNQDISGWDVSSVTNMSAMFLGAISFNQDISGWDVGSLTNMNSMFYNANSFNQNLSDWDVSSVTNMLSVFRGASSFNQDIGSWNVSNVSNMENFALNAGFNTANYDAILISWNNLASPPQNISIRFSTAYTAGGAAEAARTNLINTHGWTITDLGGI